MANIKILPYADQDAALQRQMKLAELLQEQGAIPQQQQIVSNRVVKNSPLIGLSKLLETYIGKKKEQDVTAKQAELKKQAQSEANSWLERISNAQDPTLAYRETPIMENASDEDRTELQPKMIQQDTDEQRGDMVPAMQRTPFVKPGMSDKEMNLELMRAMSSGNPMMQNTAQMYASLRPKATPVEYGTEPRYDQNGNAFLVGRDGSILPMSGISKPADKAGSQSEFDKQWLIFKQEHPNGTLEQFKRLGAAPQSVVNWNDPKLREEWTPESIKAAAARNDSGLLVPLNPENAAGAGGREATAFSRMVGAGNQAVKTLENITEMPTIGNTGILGMGGAQSHSILGTTVGTLKNKLSSQEVQTYNTVIAGLERNLAGIEAAGLMPSGTLTNKMGAVVFQPGDTEITKLRKLAEARQIVEDGLSPWLANPRIAPEQKKLISEITDRLSKAVPYTHHDLTMFEMSADKNKKLSDVVSGGTSSATPSDSISAPVNFEIKSVRKQ